MKENLIGQALKEARLAKGVTQAVLGSRLGYSAMAISHFENGTRVMRTEDLKRASEILECDLVIHSDRNSTASTTLFRATSARGSAGAAERSLQAFNRHIQKKYGNEQGTEKSN